MHFELLQILLQIQYTFSIPMMEILSCNGCKGLDSIVWSSEGFQENFASAAKILDCGALVSQGSTFICQERFNGYRFMTWEIVEGVVCLKEVSLVTNLMNSNVCIRFGATPILAVCVGSTFDNEEGIHVTLRVVQQDGTVHILQLQSLDDNVSVLDQLVVAAEGKTVNFGKLVSAHIPHLGLGNSHKRRQQSGSSNSSAALPTLRSFSGRVRSLPEDRDILCAAWLGSGLLLLGLSKGDVLFVSAAPAAAEANSGVRVGQELRLTEQLVKDRGSGLQALLSGFLAGAADANCDTTAIAAQSATALAANRSGELRLWSAATRQLVAQVSLYDLLDAVGAVGDLAPPHFQHRAARGAAPDKSILLQECIVRLSEDRGAGAAQTPPFLLAALAVLPEEAHTGDSVQNARRGLGPAVGLVAGSIPLSQQAWQVLLLGWSESTAPSGAAADKPKLIAQPIRFPIGAVCGCDAALGYTYRNAALVDVHLAVDEARGVAVVTTCWRAEAGCDASSERVLFEGLVGRTEVPLQELRAQDYTPPGPTGAGPTRLAELVAPGQMALSRHGAEHDRLRLRSEDEIFFRQLEDSVLSMSQSASAEVERAVQASALQRIFLNRRFSSRTICAAHDALSLKHARAAEESVAGGMMLEAFSAPVAPTLSLDKSTPFAQLPLLVTQLCRRVAASRLHRAMGGASVPALREDRSLLAVAHGQKFLQLLLNSFEDFLRECEGACSRASRVCPGSLSCLPSPGGFAVLARAGGEHNLVYATEVKCLQGEQRGRYASLLSLAEQQYASNSEVQAAFTELPCLLDKFLSQGGVSAGSAQWVEQYFASLAPSLHGLIASLPTLNNVVCINALLDSLDGAEEWQAFADGALDALAGVKAPCTLGSNPSPLASEPSAALQLLLVVVRERVRRCMLVLTLLASYLNGAAARLSAEVAAAARDVHVPQAVKKLLQYASVLWLDARRPASNHMLRHEVELAQLLPLSGLGTADPAGAVAVDSRFSVLENFVRFRCATERAATLEGAVSQLLVALQPSVHSGLSAFLFSAGQYACLSRWVSVTLLAPYDVVATVGEDAYAASAELLAAMARFGGRSMQLTAELYELLRMQWYALRTQSTDASVTRSATRLERAVAAKATELMACAQEVAVVALDFTCNRAVSATPSPVPSPARALASVDMGVGVEASAQRLVDEAVALLLEQGRLVALHGASTARQETIAQRLHFDGLLALASALLSLNSQASGSSTTRTHPLQAFRGEDNRAVALLSDHCGGLCEVLGRVGLQDVLEIVDRALPLLPRAFGAALAHDGARQLAAAVAQSLDAFPTEASLKLREEAYTLLAELHSAWSRAFEYALLHGGRYGDALDALMRVAELEEQRLVDAAALSPAAMTWRDALRALVAQACEAGCLGWLCSIPEQQLEGFAKQGVSLGEAISATLEMLAATLDPPSASSVAVNYYECLLVFQFSRRDFHEGARAMYTLCSRSESRESAASRAASSAAAVEQQARCLAATAQALAVLPPGQRFLLHRAAATSSHNAAKQLTENAPPRSHIHFCTEASLRDAFVTQQSTLAALRAGAAAAQVASAPQSVLALCNLGRFQEALSLALVHDAAHCEGVPRLVHIPVMALVKLCVVGAESAEFATKVELQRFLWTATNQQVSPVGIADSSRYWRDLTDMVRMLRRRGVPGVDEGAVHAALDFHRKSENPVALQLPHQLVDEMCGFPSALAPGPVHSPPPSLSPCSMWMPASADLLGALMDHQSLTEACSLATRLVRCANDFLAGDSARAAAGCQLWMPYCHLDRLIALCSTPLEQPLHGRSQEEVRLQKEFTEFQRVMSHHFTVLLLA